MGAFNETTGQAYQGKNVMRMLVAEGENGYDERHGWAGFKQWVDAGRVVRKGEHGVACLTVVNAGATTNENGERVGGTRKPRGFRVFHYDQTTELEQSEEAAS